MAPAQGLVPCRTIVLRQCLVGGAQLRPCSCCWRQRVRVLRLLMNNVKGSNWRDRMEGCVSDKSEVGKEGRVKEEDDEGRNSKCVREATRKARGEI